VHEDPIGIWSVGFCGGRKTGEPGEKPSEQEREPTLNSTHIWHRAGIEPGPHWWEASALTTAPPLLPSVWSDGSIKGLEVFLSTSKVSTELGTYMTRLVKKVKTYIDNRYTVLRHVDSPSMSLRQYAGFRASKRSAGHFRVLANS